MIENLRELFTYRALLWSLITRDLKARYRGSFLGFLWTFLNPLILMAVYSLVFGVYQRNPMENFTYFLFVGLLPWLWFSTSLVAGTSAISDRRDLITKVKFPPQVLPAQVIGSAFANYLLTMPLMFAFAAWRGVTLGLPVVVLPFLFLLQALFSMGLVYITSSINVVFRDLQHILQNFVQFALFLTPVLYSVDQMPPKYRDLVLTVNPLATLVGAYQDVLFYNRWPNVERLGMFAALALLLLQLGSMYMAAKHESFAESA